MITNIVDKRTRGHRWKRVRLIAEATWHDNTVADADQATQTAGEVDYDTLDDMSLAEGIAWGESLPGEVTLFIYDAPEVDVPMQP